MASLLGAVLLLVALFTPLAAGRDPLVSDPLETLGLAIAVALALTAAVILRGPGDRRLGFAVLVGVMPAIALVAITWTATLVKERPEVAAGSVLLYAGSALLALAGGRAIGRLRGSVGLLGEPTDADVAVAVVSGLLGLGAGLASGYAATGEFYGTRFSTLVVRLALVSGGVVVLRYWAAGSRLLPPKAVRPIAAALSVAAVASFVAGSGSSEAADNVLLGVGAVAALASAVIPLVSTLLNGRRVGAAMLGAWVATQGSLVIRQPLLLLPYVGAMAVAVVLWQRIGDDHTATVATPSRSPKFV